MTVCWWSRPGSMIWMNFLTCCTDEPLDQWYEIGNVIALVDAHLEEKLSAEAEYLLASQAANAGCVILK